MCLDGIYEENSRSNGCWSRRSLSVASNHQPGRLYSEEIRGVECGLNRDNKKKIVCTILRRANRAERRAEKCSSGDRLSGHRRPKVNSFLPQTLTLAHRSSRRDEVTRKKIQFLRVKKSSGGREAYARTSSLSSLSSLRLEA